MSWMDKPQSLRLLLFISALAILASAALHLSIRESQREECAELGGTVHRSVFLPSGVEIIKKSPAPIQISCVSEDGNVLKIFPAIQPN